MRSEKSRSKVFNRRMALIAGGKVAFLSALAGRLYYLQVVESDRYLMLADKNRINLLLLPPPRGYIVDRRGTPLAVNTQNYRVVIVPEQTSDIGATLSALGQLIDLSAHDIRRVERGARRRRAFVPITVRDYLSWEEVSRVEVNAPNLPGISIDVGQSRYYPHGAALAHVLGYVAAVSEEELTGDPLLELPEFRVGKNGIEKRYDSVLRGTAGNSQVEVNALGRVIRELRRSEGQAGQQVTLTLDLRLQQFVSRRIQDERSASVVVLDVDNGDILAMVSTPSFDPNAFNEGLSTEAWAALTTNSDAPLINKAIAGQYAPGSTFKPVVAMAALEAGISRDTKVFCKGHIDLGDRRFHCWNEHGHGDLAMHGAIRVSCDVWFYEIARRLGVDRIAAMAKRFGLGTRLGIDLAGERPGLVPTRGWKRATLNAAWQGGETLVTGIGQGYVLTTPLQLAAMTAQIVNGGHRLQPNLLHDPSARSASPRGGTSSSLGFSPASLKFMIGAMSDVVNAPNGTAHASRITRAKWAMGGKTGTSQVRRITVLERERGVKKNIDRPWKDRDHALFVGFAPVDRPRYAISVVVEHGGAGAKMAAPMARDILTELQRRGLGGGRLVRASATWAAGGKAMKVVEQ